jgi:hypothetical protein
LTTRSVERRIVTVLFADLVDFTRLEPRTHRRDTDFMGSTAETRPIAALELFLSRDVALFALLSFIGDVTTLYDEAVQNSARAELILREVIELESSGSPDVVQATPGGELDEEEARLRSLAEGVAATEKHFVEEHLVPLTELLLTAAVDNFLTYVSGLLNQIFVERPETLTSNETVRLEEVLQFASMEDLVASLAERRVERLAYQSLDALAANLEKTLGFRLFEDREEQSRATRLVATRNLLTHNRGVANSRFLQQVPDSGYTPGDAIRLVSAEVGSDLDFLTDCARRIDVRAIEKFSLSRAGTLGDPGFSGS